LDSQLRQQAVGLAAAVGPATLAAWRDSCRADSHWWWSLDRIAEQAQPAPNPLWVVSIGLLVAISLSLAGDISRRFLAGGPDFLGIFSTVSQALLALAAGSSLSAAGQKWGGRVAARLGLTGPHAITRVNWAFALIVFFVIVAFRLTLPGVARLYNDRGARLQAAGNTSTALLAFRRALSLNPDYAQASYNLAGVHEDLLEYDEAIKRYQQAISLDDRFYAAYNNLARLYITRRSDAAAAIRLLRRALRSEPDDQSVRYSLHKNLGWAELKANRHTRAEHELQQAVGLRPDDPAAHCLLAQTLDASGRPDAALGEFEKCVAYAAGAEQEVEPEWLAIAEKRLEGAGQ
jgi:tetratricopeptide (TPR) repeat protein